MRSSMWRRQSAHHPGAPGPRGSLPPCRASADAVCWIRLRRTTCFCDDVAVGTHEHERTALHCMQSALHGRPFPGPALGSQ